MKRGSIIKLIATVLLLAVACVFSIQPLTDPKTGIPLGLDLRGGVHLILQAEPGETGAEVTNEDMDNAKSVIEKRVNEMGLSEPIVQTDLPNKRIIVDLAGVQDPDKAVDILKTTAKLTFRDPQGNVLVEGSDLKDARAATDQQGRFVVNLTFSAAGANKFADATTRLVGQQMGIYLDDKLLQNPRVDTPIANGQAEITGYSSLEDAANYAVLMRSGALPVSLSIVEKRQVGASLGVDSLNKSLYAGAFGLAFIFLFMLVMYRLPGIVADLSLILLMLINLWVLQGFRAVLTLPGIAGLILTLAMAVDLNIIIYERIKEELKLGKSLRAAVEAGFSRAFLAVFDSNITTLFAAVTLYFFGTSSIKGFAITLGVGIIASLFTAVTFTRAFLRWIVHINPKMDTKWFGVRKSHTDKNISDKNPSNTEIKPGSYEEVKNYPFYFNIVRKRYWYFAISGIILVAGLFSLFTRGLNLGVDFTGGSMYEITFDQPVTQAAITDTLQSVGLSGSVQLTGDNIALIRTEAFEENQRNAMLTALEDKVGSYDKASLKEDKVGPSIGKELTRNALLALGVAAILMLIYISFRFQWAYAVSGIAALFHDILVTVGIFSIFWWPVDSTFVAAILTIFGSSINDTVVIFDRIRENEPRMKRGDSYEDMVDKSNWQTMGRSLKTIPSVLVALLALLILGGDSTRTFALAMVIGVIIGSYSSVFNASQILVEIKLRMKSTRGRKPSHT